MTARARRRGIARSRSRARPPGAARHADLLAALAAQRVIPVLLSRDVDDAVATARACARAGAGGDRADAHDAGEVERRRWSCCANDGLLLGLGTLTDPAQVAPAAAAGARFVVSF